MFTQPKDNSVIATYQYLKSIGAKVNEETVEETLKNHPDYPSLLATSDAFNEWNIENVSVRIKPEQLFELPTPFLGYLHIEGGLFIVVNVVNQEYIEWYHTKEGKKKERIDNFLKKWGGVALVAETNANSGEKEFAENHKKELLAKLRVPILLIGVIFLIGYLLYKNLSIDTIFNTLLLTKLAGTIVSILLLWQSIDKNNPFIQTLCTAGGKKSDCNHILNSKTAQLTSWLSWSEVGFFYFAGGFLALNLDSSTIILLGLGMVSFIYTLWSIYYQGFIAKQWCSLCLAIQGIIVIEFGLSIYSINNSSIGLGTFLNSSLGSVAFGVVAVILFWLFLKPILIKSQQVLSLKNDLKRFKNNPDLFYNLLKSQEEMPVVACYLEPVKIGNPEVEHTITMVTNPFCQPCARTHKIIDDLLESNANLNCQVIFAASNMEGDKSGVVARSILSLPKEKQAEALKEWYKNEERSIEKWQKQFKIIEDEKAIKIIEQHSMWCEMAKIEGTPILYFDGFRKPELYRIEDLKGILKYLPISVA